MFEPQEAKFFTKFLKGEAGYLVEMYYSIPADTSDSLLPSHSLRSKLLLLFIVLSLDATWAQEELLRLDHAMWVRNEDAPRVLVRWLRWYIHNKAVPAEKGRPAGSKINFQTLHFAELARRRGGTQMEIVKFVCAAHPMKGDGVKSRIMRARLARERAMKCIFQMFATSGTMRS